MDVALPKQDVSLALQLDLSPLLGVVENTVAELDLAHMLADRHYGGPGQPLADTGGRGYYQATTGLALAGLPLS